MHLILGAEECKGHSGLLRSCLWHAQRKATTCPHRSTACSPSAKASGVQQSGLRVVDIRDIECTNHSG